MFENQKILFGIPGVCGFRFPNSLRPWEGTTGWRLGMVLWLTMGTSLVRSVYDFLLSRY